MSPFLDGVNLFMYNCYMSRYTLKSYCGSKQVECYTNRNISKLRSILTHPTNQSPGETNAWGDLAGSPDRFEIYNSRKEKIFSGDATGAIQLVNNL